MLQAFYRLSILHQTAIVLFSVTLAAFTCFTGYVAWDTNRSMLQQSEYRMQQEANMTSQMFELLGVTLEHDTDRLGEIFYSLFPGKFSVSGFETTLVSGQASPVMFHDDEPLNLNFENVDYFTSMTGGVATVFVRDNDDFLRITTSLKKENGDRAIGTYLGKKHPGYKKILNGEKYFGRARLFGREYMTEYIPIEGNSGRIIGILFIGFDFTNDLQSLKDTVRSMKIGETGFAYVVDNNSKNKGMLVSHPTMEGKPVLDLASASGRSTLSRLLTEKNGLVTYTPSAAMGDDGKRLATWKYMPGWNWVVVVEASEKELSAASASLRNKLILISLLVCALMTAMMYVILQKQLQPLKDFIPKLRLIGQGDLTQKLDISGYKISTSQTGSGNEIRALGAHINEMVERFQTLVTGVLDAALTSRFEGHKRIETPWLAKVAYRCGAESGRRAILDG